MALALLPLSTACPIASSLRASNASSIRCSLTVPCAVPVSLSSSSSPSSSASSSFLFSPLVSSFAGLSLSGISFIFGTDNSKTGPKRDVIVAAKKFQLGQTKRHKNKMCLARVHGFFARMSSAGGRKVLKRRRAKGRHILCTKTHASTGKRHVPAHGKGKRRRRR